MVNDNTSADEMTFGEHLDVLRKIIVKVAVVAAVAFVIIFALFKQQVVDTVFAPAMPSFPTNRLLDMLATATGTEELRINTQPLTVYNTKIAGQFALHIKAALCYALIITFPYMIARLWGFVKPALTHSVRRKSRRAVVAIPMWFVAGICFGYFIIAPLAVDFLTSYNASSHINNIIDIDSYTSTVLGVSLASGIIFQLPLLIRVLATVGVITSAWMRRNRKYAVVLLLIIAAAITPPDVMSQLLIFIPLYALYEYGIIIAGKIEKAKMTE